MKSDRVNPNFFVWQPLSALPVRFAIECSAPGAHQSARRLFAPWIVENPAGSVEIARRWRIEHRGGDSWSLASDDSSHVAGAFAFDAGAQPLAELLAQIEYASIAHLVAHLPPEFVGLHSALLSRPRSEAANCARRAVIVVGPKESGKSTLACALWRAGWTLHCDDYTLLDGRGCAQPTARRVSLRPGSRELLGEELWQSALRAPSTRVSASNILFHPHEIEGRERARVEPLKVGAICFLKRRDIETAPASSSPLGGIEAALALLPYSSLLLEAGTIQFASQCEDWGARLSKIANLLEKNNIPLYDLGRGHPTEMIREVERLVQLN